MGTTAGEGGAQAEIKPKKTGNESLPVSSEGSPAGNAAASVKEEGQPEVAADHEGPLSGVPSSVLFSPVRVVGRVTCGIPFALSVHGVDSFVCCSVGRGFHLYDTKRLQQQVASPRLPVSVRCLCFEGPFVYVGLKDKIVAFNRLSPVQIFTGAHSLSIDGMVAVGPLLLSHSKAEVVVWQRDTGRLVRKLPLQGALQVTRLLHPETYINKVLIARGGRLELWNFSTGHKVHEFRCMDTSADSGSTSNSITALAPSPSPDVVAVGFSSGRICVVDIKGDELLLVFQHSSAQGAVTALAFRPDCGAIADASAAAAALAALVSGSSSGALLIWSLTEGRLLEAIPHAHADGVVHVQFLPAQPIMLTNGGLGVWDGALLCCRYFDH